MFIEDAVIMIY